MSEKDQGNLADDEDQPAGAGVRTGGRNRRSRGRPRRGSARPRRRGRSTAASPATRSRMTEYHRKQYSKTIRIETVLYDKLVSIQNERHKATVGDTIYFLIERYEIHQAVSPKPIPRPLSSTPLHVVPPKLYQETPLPLPPRELFQPLGTPTEDLSLSPIKLDQPSTSIPLPTKAASTNIHVHVPLPTIADEGEGDEEQQTEADPLNQSCAIDTWNIMLPPQDMLDETIPYGRDWENREDDSFEDSFCSSSYDTSTVSSMYEPSPPHSSDSEARDEAMQEYLEHVEFLINPDRPELIGLQPDSEREEDVNVDEDPSEESDVDAGEFNLLSSTSDAMRDNSTLAYTSCLLKLSLLKVPVKCTRKGCSSNVTVETKQTGSAMYLIWICDGTTKHTIKKWCSQPRFKFGQHFGDFQICAGTLFTGNNFSKVATLCHAINMKPPSDSTYTRVQRNHAIPAVKNRWKEVNDEVLARLSRKDSIVILGDGRMDSPGFCAQYCTYTFLENDSKDIVSMDIVDKRHVKGISVNMEKFGFVKGLDTLQDRGITIEEVVTDAHTQITALIKRQYPDIHHSYDVWHGAKNLAKKLITAAAESDCGIILQWVHDITNHFWYCAREAVNYTDFMAKWRGLLHHVCGKHEWLPLEGYDDGKCGHGELEAVEKELFTSGSKAHNKLRHIILDAYFLGRVEKYLNFRSTSELEAFNNKILGFASKRFFFQYPGYSARCMLAGLDYQENKTNMPLTTKAGQPMLRRVYRKRSNRWDVIPAKQKTFEYVRTCMEMATMDRIQSPTRLRQKAILGEDDPRRIATHSAKVPPPPTKDIYAAKRSRKDSD